MNSEQNIDTLKRLIRSFALVYGAPTPDVLTAITSILYELIAAQAVMRGADPIQNMDEYVRIMDDGYLEYLKRNKDRIRALEEMFKGMEED